MMPSTAPTTGLQVLIEKAQSDLFSSIAPAQRPYLAEAWANLRHAAAALAQADHGRVPNARLLEAIEHARSGILALQAIAEP